jgi:hypothetical protein
MKRQIITLATILVIAMAAALQPIETVSGQSSNRSVTAAASAALPGGATLGGVQLSSLRIGQGVLISGNGTARGQIAIALLGNTVVGQPQTISIEGEASSGSVNANGSASVSGNCTLDMGDGTPPVANVPFTVTVTAGSVALRVGATSLPVATLNVGSITIR